MTTYAMSGDLGDIIYSLRICEQVNDPRSTYYVTERPFTKPWNPARLEAILPLMNAQPYLGKATYEEPKEKPTHDFTDFRRGGLPWGKPLAEIHAEWVGFKLGPYRPWLTAKPSPKTKGKVLAHRSPRYHNPKFPWAALGEAFGDRMLGVGVPDEHEELQTQLGVEIPLIETKTYLELAELIAGCGLFIGNQSSPMSIALGLGVPSVQEVSLRQPDCVYKGANTCYSYNGGVTIDGTIYGNPEIDRISTQSAPPGGWVAEKDGKRETSWSLKAFPNLGMTAEDVLLANTIRVRRDYPTFQPSKVTELDRLVGPTEVTSRLNQTTAEGNVPYEL